MNTAVLSEDGHIAIPKPVLAAHFWKPGLEFMVVETLGGILLKPKTAFPETTLEEAAGCLRYTGKAKTQEEMEEAIKRGVKEAWRDRD
jgi:bifunctional DNA-binding transcriptional regulator/antitoxin component of YhaV-PrlF toxin-antitoxin module